VSVGVWQNYFIEKAQEGKAPQKGKAQKGKAQEGKAQEESTEWMSTQRTFLSVFNITPRRGRKPIAQGNALGISMRLGSPCKGKSLTLSFMLLPLQGAGCTLH